MTKLYALLIALAAAGCATATNGPTPLAMVHGTPKVPGGCEAPSSQNHGRNGCYFDAAVEVGRLPPQVYWHIDEYPTREAALAASTPASAVVVAYGRYFLETVNASTDWRPSGGTRLATVGPLPTPQNTPVTAQFMQGMTNPGMTTRPHLHPGPEAFYLLDGGICMETPAGIETAGKGSSYWIDGNIPMQLTSAPGGVRRSVLVVLHPSGQPWMTAPGWTAKGVCPGAN